MADAEGIDVDRVTYWFEENIAGARRPLQFELIAGGRSNLTFHVQDGTGHEFVLRRPPTSHVLPTAHDMTREHRIISALGPTAVPVPPVLGLCTDDSVNGAPFYVMGFVTGHVLRDLGEAEAALSPESRRHAGEDLIDVLVDLHAVDLDAVGLANLARQEDYIPRQLKRWYAQYQSTANPDRRTVIDEMHDFLVAHTPAQGPATIVHGDYRLDNTMLDDAGNVVAVLDWELCTLGDPLADVGLLMCYWADSGDPQMIGSAATTAPGFPNRADLKARYAARSGRDLASIDFYVSFGFWKLACIMQGVFARYSAGAMGDDSFSFAGIEEQVLGLGQLAKSAAANL